MSAIEELYQAAKENQRRGHKVITLAFVIEKLEKNEAEASISPIRAKETKYRDLV